MALDIPHGHAGRFIGKYDTAVGAAWVDLTSSSFTDLTTAAAVASSGLSFAALYIANDHATQDLYLLLKANAAEATTLALKIAAGETKTLEGLIGAAGGTDISTIAIQGSGASTALRIEARFR